MRRLKNTERAFKARRSALGIVVGLTIGLLVLSELVVIIRLPIMYFILFSFGLILILPIAVGIIIGILFVRKIVQRDFSWPAVALFALFLWPTAVALPFGVQIISVRNDANNAVPTYPGNHLVDTTVKLGDYENNGDRVYIRFVAEADLSDILKFYRTDLALRGWEEGPQHFIESKHDGTPYWFNHKRTFEFIHIKVWPQEQKRTIVYEVVYGL